MNYHNRTFRSASNSSTGEVSADTTFRYRQHGNIVTATYSGGEIVEGHLIALADEQGNLDMRYHHINTAGHLMTGVCRSIPEQLADGRLRLHEKWQWTSGDGTQGQSTIEEITEPSPHTIS